ncbi:MAG: glycyl-tRNA synthetase [Parcubacteria group bacterium Gr01-1014_30]|nr:MAG: glycyl-tRNA synthetase [Parcubacteria group bacterium Gr01-1014_30]
MFPGSEIYGGLSNSYDYGPLGVELKNNIKKVWWERFVHRRDDMVGIDAAIIMNPKVWEASGHVKEFYDSLMQCKKCNSIFRDDEIPGFIVRHDKYDAGKVKDLTCPECKQKGDFTSPTLFSLMFETNLGPVKDRKSNVYLRPETAQAMFVDFKQILDTNPRLKIPFGIAQIGKAFRNEVTPGNFIFRTREFEMMEIEYFIREKEWKKWFDYWLDEMKGWLRDDLGISDENLEFVEIPEGERAHYSKRTIDIEYQYPFGQKELYGLAYRTDFDLKAHFKELPYRDPETGEEFWPHVVEPTWGVDRSVLVVLLESYTEEKDRVVLRLPPKLAPYKAAVFPLLANKPELVKLARKIYEDLRKDFTVAWDDRGNIGKRYYSQDEIATPWCITVDFDSLKDKTVTMRDRDTTKQKRVKISNLAKTISEALVL